MAPVVTHEGAKRGIRWAALGRGERGRSGVTRGKGTSMARVSQRALGGAPAPAAPRAVKTHADGPMQRSDRRNGTG
jgi:hypothetical protein